MKASIIPVLLVAVVALSQATERESYTPALEQAPWQFQRDDKQCRLVQALPRAGRALFVQGREGAVQFRLQGMRKPERDLLAVIRLEPAPWQHGLSTETLAEVLLSAQETAMALPPAQSGRLMQELEHGRVISLHFPDFADGQHALSLRLLPVGFRSALAEFLPCPASLPEPPPPELPPEPPRYVIWFATDSAELTEAAATTVQAVCKDVKNYGAAVQQVVLEARADERGSEDYNLRLSEDRARTVAEALVACGVQETQLVIHVLGESRPDPQGSEPESWRKNRRVVISLPGVQKKSRLDTATNPETDRPHDAEDGQQPEKISADRSGQDEGGV